MPRSWGRQPPPIIERIGKTTHPIPPTPFRWLDFDFRAGCERSCDDTVDVANIPISNARTCRMFGI